MTRLILVAACLMSATAASPVLAATTLVPLLAATGGGADGATVLERRGRGRGGDDRSSGRRPRVPGGSGCDSAHDLAEHPECR